MKKNNGRRKANGRRKKGRHQPLPQSKSRAQPCSPPGAQHARSHSSARRLGFLSTALHRIDWPALAIVIIPLAVMALLQTHGMTPSHQLARPAPWHGDLSIEAMPVFPEPAAHLAIAPVEPQLPPWHGKLALEAMPLFPEPTNHTAHASDAPAPEAWHGNLALEAMPLFPEPANHASHAPAEPPLEPWHGDLTLEAMPLFPEPTNHAPTKPSVALGPPPLCVPDEASIAATAIPPADFSRALARAARAQTNDFIIYNARYISLAYPGGDTPALYGVCTDVVIRAYRALDIDLQELIHASRLGNGDPSIDHRRVEVVRRFLTRHGTSLPISEFAEDYRPGDIVTYHRPEGRISQHHIAIVSEELAPSGRPLIIHNRGWGPQIEDALFVDRITGHYRLSPEQVDAFLRTRAPRVSERRRRTAESSTTTRR